MSRRKKYPKRRKRHSFQPTKSDYVFYEDPLNGVSLKERISYTKQISEFADTDYSKNLERLEQLILDSQPKAVLSILSAEYLAKPGGISKEWQEKSPVLQHHIELIQSLALKHRREDFRRNFPDIDEIRRLSKLVCDQFWQKRSTDINIDLTEVQRKKRAFEESTRIGTQVLRNWGYPQHIRAILTDLWAPLDQEFEKVWRVKPTKLIDMFFNLSEQCEEKLNRHQKKLHSVLTQKSVTGAIEMYKNKFYLEPSENLDELASAGLSRVEVLGQLWTHSVESLSFLVHGCFKEEILKAYNGDVDWTNLKKVLALWSLSFGDTAKIKTDFLFMGSPIRESPFITEIDDYYYLPIPNLLFSFTDVLLEQLFKGNKALKTLYDDRKGPFVEEDLHIRLAKAFPRAEVFHGSYFRVGTEQFENDILVLIDNYAIIIEAKAANVSDSAKRAGNTVDYYVGELFIKPAEQAARFQKYLEDNRGLLEFNTKRRVVNTVDTTKIEHFLRLGVVFDDVSLTWKWEDLVEAGFIPRELVAIPIIFLADFHIILDLLERTCDIIHYFERRTWLVRNASYEGDELDLLVFYLETGMRIDSKRMLPNQILRVEVTGRSALLEPFFTAQFSNINEKKPKPRMMPWLEQLLSRVELLEQPRWIEMGLLLLNIEYDKQEIIANKIATARKSVSKRLGPALESISFTNFWPTPEELLLILVHKGFDASERNDRVSQHCQRLFDRSCAQRAIAMTFEPDCLDFTKAACLFYAGKNILDSKSASETTGQ